MGDMLDGQVAVITGGASGIGAATARRFSAEGAAVIIADLSEPMGAALAAELPRAHFIRTDVSDEAQVAAAVEFAVSQHGRIDCMVNNAGLIGAVGTMLDTTAAHWRATLAVLLDGVFFGMKHAARHMVPQRSGCILSVSSVAGLQGGLGAHAYTTAKHAVIGLTKSAASEFAAYGIRVNAVAPGSIVTPIGIQARGGDLNASIAGSIEANPLGRVQMPEEIAGALAYLASNDALNVSGHTLVVDGGRTSGRAGQLGPNFHLTPAGFRGPTTQA